MKSRARNRPGRIRRRNRTLRPKTPCQSGACGAIVVRRSGQNAANRAAASSGAHSNGGEWNMDSATKLIKTPKGKEEIEQRRYKLAGKLRTLLILVDGSRSVVDLADDGRRLGAPEDALIVLMRDGFVAPRAGVEAANDAKIGDVAAPAAPDEASAGDEYAH